MTHQVRVRSIMLQRWYPAGLHRILTQPAISQPFIHSHAIYIKISVSIMQSCIKFSKLLNFLGFGWCLYIIHYTLYQTAQLTLFIFGPSSYCFSSTDRVNLIGSESKQYFIWYYNKTLHYPPPSILCNVRDDSSSSSPSSFSSLNVMTLSDAHGLTAKKH